MTYDINEHYGVTVSQAQAGRPYIAIGEVFSRRTMQNVGIRVRGEGRTWASAADRAIAHAKAECPMNPPGDE